jgi:hypothetical protein
LIRLRTLLAICALALPIPAAAVGCGGDDTGGDEDPQEVVDATFGNEEKVTDANVDLTVGVSAEGDQSASFDLSLTGPIQGDPDDPNAIPQLDWTLSASGEGGGQSIDFEGALVVTEDNAYVEYQDQAYEVGTDQFAQLKDQLESQAKTSSEQSAGASFQEGCEQALKQAGGTNPSACDIDFGSWLTNLSNEGNGDVEGTDTIHISGDANVEQILTDIGEIAASVPQAQSSSVDLSQLGQFAAAVPEASMDVYSGADDNLLRKLDVSLTIDPSEIAAGPEVPVDSINVDFSLTLSDVNTGSKTIEAPSNAKPIEDLVGQIPGRSGLGGSALPITPGGGGGTGGSAGSAAYQDCIAKAQTLQDLNKCTNEP